MDADIDFLVKTLPHPIRSRILTNQMTSAYFPDARKVRVNGDANENSSLGTRRPSFDMCPALVLHARFAWRSLLIPVL